MVRGVAKRYKKFLLAAFRTRVSNGYNGVPVGNCEYHWKLLAARMRVITPLIPFMASRRSLTLRRSKDQGKANRSLAVRSPSWPRPSISPTADKSKFVKHCGIFFRGLIRQDGGLPRGELAIRWPATNATPQPKSPR